MIPKVNSPEKVAQFRPNNLCNVVYKVISKMVCACLNVILPDAINSTWSAFVPERIITNNVLVAYECLHTTKKKMECKEGLCAIKFDMHKAYGRVEWTFLKKVMLKLRFYVNWVN